MRRKSISSATRVSGLGRVRHDRIGDAGAHYATALHNVAAIFESEGRLTEAAQYYTKALAARQALLPAGHAHTEITRAALKRVERAELMAAKKHSTHRDVSALLR